MATETAGAEAPSPNDVAQRTALEDLFPGYILDFPGANGKKLTVEVFPLGVTHLRKFNHQLEAIVPKLARNVDFAALREKGDEAIADLLPMLAPMILTDLLDLVDACTKGVDLINGYVPHWILPKIIERWLLESFGEAKKIQPWVTAIETMMEKVIGEKVGIWDTLCKRLSPPDTTSGTSSSTDNPASPTQGGQ